MKATKSIACKSCKCSYWYMMIDTAECVSCGHERPFTPRKRGVHITPSQQKAVDRLRKLFLNTFAGKEYGLAEDKTEMTKYGNFVYTVKTGGNIYVAKEATICIGRRGGLDIWTTGYGVKKSHLLHGYKYNSSYSF